MMIQINAWFPNTGKDLVEYLQKILINFGFMGTGQMNNDYYSWKVLTYHNDEVWSSVRTYTEDSICFELKVKSIPEYSLDHFILLYNTLIGNTDYIIDREFIPDECVISDSNPDLYPFFVGAFRAPISMNIIEDDSNEYTEYLPDDEDYWDKMYEKMLHFVSSNRFTREGIPNQSQWSKHINAPIINSTHGFIFDCGWEKTWGKFPERDDQTVD